LPVCRGFNLQGSFLFLGIHAAAVAAAKAGDKQNNVLWSTSGALLFAIFPYTMVALMPTTKRILRQVWLQHACSNMLTGHASSRTRKCNPLLLRVMAC
jgi:hypothetical protein